MSEDSFEIIVTKEIAAPVESVYKAWIQPSAMKQWFAPGNMTVKNAEVNLTVGGRYLVHMYDPDESTDHIVSGTYEEIIPNKKLVFNWMWEDGVDCSLVTVEFTAKGEDTAVTLTHRGFSQEKFRDIHLQGWNACLASLYAYLTAGSSFEE